MAEDVVQNNGIPSNDFGFGAMTLVISGTPDITTWKQMGLELENLGWQLQWYVGAWLKYGRDHFPDEYLQFINHAVYKPTYCANVLYVEDRVPYHVRRQNLSWSHHQAVAQLEPDQQEDFLSAAEKNFWSRAQLRAAVKVGDPEYDPFQDDVQLAADVGAPTITTPYSISLDELGDPESIRSLMQIAPLLVSHNGVPVGVMLSFDLSPAELKAAWQQQIEFSESSAVREEDEGRVHDVSQAYVEAGVEWFERSLAEAEQMTAGYGSQIEPLITDIHTVDMSTSALEENA